MITQTINLNMVPGAVCPVIHVNQYDNDSGALRFNLFQGSAFQIPSGSSVVINGTKPDGYGFSYSASFSGNVVTADLTQQMTAVAGEVKCELRITKDSDVIGTQNFTLMVEPAALDDSTIISDSDIPAIANAEQYAAEAAQSAAQAASTLSSAVKYSDLVNNATYTGAAGAKALDAKMGKTLADAIDNKMNVTMGAANNPTLKFGVGSNADPTVNPHIELRRAGASGSYALSLMYYDSEGSTTGNTVQLVSPTGDVLPTLAPKNHAGSSAATYGGGTASSYGHVKLSDSYTSSGGAAANSVGASSKALVDAYNALDGADVKGAILAGSGSATFTIGSESNVGVVIANRNSNTSWSVSLVSTYATAVAQVAAGSTPPVSIAVNTSTRVVTVTNNTSYATGVIFITR